MNKTQRVHTAIFLTSALYAAVLRLEDLRRSDDKDLRQIGRLVATWKSEDTWSTVVLGVGMVLAWMRLLPDAKWGDWFVAFAVSGIPMAFQSKLGGLLRHIRRNNLDELLNSK